MLCDHSLESYRTVLSCGAVCFVIQCCSNLLVCGSNHAEWPFFGKLPNSSFMWCCFFVNTDDQDRDTKKEQALSITFSQSDWFIAQNERFWLAITTQ